MIDKTLAIIAGGKSIRMGEDKSKLIYKGKTFIDNIIEASQDFREIMVISNNKNITDNKKVRIIEDIHIGYGPMGGIYTALINSKYEKVLCIACDMPLIKRENLNLIGEFKGEYEVLIPKIEDKIEPLCSVYSKISLGKIEDLLKYNKVKLMDFIKESNYKFISENLEVNNFFNINTKKDYRRLEDYDVYDRNNNK